MRWLYLEEKFLLNTRIEECSALVKKAMNELGFKAVRTKKEVQPRYLLLECDYGWGHGKRDIEFLFKERENGSELAIKWPYAIDMGYGTNQRSRDFHTHIIDGRKQEEGHRVEEFKARVGAIDVPTVEAMSVHSKEVIKEKEVIVKIRCPYCNKLYDETLDACPHCGGKR